MVKFLIFLILAALFSRQVYSSQIEAETKKTHLEDIFIWKISDELKLSVEQEKKFTEINRSLNKKKSELNKKIQEAVQRLSAMSTDIALNKYKKLIQQYNQISLTEFEAMRQLLGTKNFISYLKIKNELTTKIKSMLIADKLGDSKKAAGNKPLPPPKVIIEKRD